MTKEFDEKRAQRVAQSEAMTAQIRGLQETTNALIADRDKINTEIMTMDETRELLAGMGFAQSTVSTAAKEAPIARRTPPVGRKPREAAAPKEKQTRPPVARPVREFLTAHGPARGDVIIAALQKHGIPGDSIEKYFRRGIRARELVRDERGLYSLPGRVAPTSHTAEAEAENRDEGMDEAADQATRGQTKPPMSTAATLDFVKRSGSLNEHQLRVANAMDAASALISRGELIVEDDLIRLPPKREPNESDDEAAE